VIERLLTADAALERGEPDTAERLYAQVAEADPRNAIAVAGLARVALARGDPDTARAHATRALEIDPDEAAARRMLESLSSPATAKLPPHLERPEAGPRPPGRQGGIWGVIRRLLRRA
jgi:tetratricopeptide (TPR) repeat protein